MLATQASSLIIAIDAPFKRVLNIKQQQASLALQKIELGPKKKPNSKKRQPHK